MDVGGVIQCSITTSADNRTSMGVACCTGVLTLTYMGTDPPTQAVNMGHSSEVDYTALDAEYRQLSSKIQSVGAPTKAISPEQQLLVTAQVQQHSPLIAPPCSVCTAKQSV